MNDLKIIISEGIRTQENTQYRQCGTCGKQFNYSQVKKKYPSACHKQLKKIWHDPDIIFYCSACYFQKLFKHLKNKKEEKI